jgi:hypothetical protein
MHDNQACDHWKSLYILLSEAGEIHADGQWPSMRSELGMFPTRHVTGNKAIPEHVALKLITPGIGLGYSHWTTLLQRCRPKLRGRELCL